MEKSILLLVNENDVPDPLTIKSTFWSVCPSFGIKESGRDARWAVTVSFWDVLPDGSGSSKLLNNTGSPDCVPEMYPAWTP